MPDLIPPEPRGSIDLIHAKQQQLSLFFQRNSGTVQEFRETFEIQAVRHTVLSATAEGWQAVEEELHSGTQLENATDAATALFRVLGDIIVDDLLDTNTRSVFEQASARFLNSHTGDIVPPGQHPDFSFNYRAKLSAALRNLDFQVVNSGSEQHPDFAVRDRRIG